MRAYAMMDGVRTIVQHTMQFVPACVMVHVVDQVLTTAKPVLQTPRWMKMDIVPAQLSGDPIIVLPIWVSAMIYVTDVLVLQL